MTVAMPTVKFEYFKSSLDTWDDMFAEAAEFATQVGRERLIGISHSQDKHQGVVAVWYWLEPGAVVT